MQGKVTNEVYGNFLVKSVVSDLAKMGYKKLRFRTDQESSCIALQAKVMAQSDQEVVLQNSPSGESQSNGVAEKAAQDVEDQVRCLKDASEEHFDSNILKNSNALPWMAARQLALQPRPRGSGRHDGG